MFVVDVGFCCYEYVLGYIEYEMKRLVSDVEFVICMYDDVDYIGGVCYLVFVCFVEFVFFFVLWYMLCKNLNDLIGSIVCFGILMFEVLRLCVWCMYMSLGW